jgi:cysteine desulfurase/selenocysteine lyase
MHKAASGVRTFCRRDDAKAAVERGCMSVITKTADQHADAAWNVEAVRREFPVLQQQVHGVPLVYLDSAATAQKPHAVMETLAHYYTHDYANVHRAIYTLAARATAAYEAARERVREFLHARSSREIVFVRGTTEAINLVATSLGSRFRPGDEVVLTTMEHHANIVPWQLLRARNGIRLRVLPVTPRGELAVEELEALLGEHTRLVAVTHVSNVLGTVNPLDEIIRIAHRHDIPVLVDGAQAVPHFDVNVEELGCDFYCFSGHKLFGPTGIGVLYGKEAWLESMPPYQGGGEMIRSVRFDETTYAALPRKFEAGTPPIAGALGLAAAIDYLNRLDREAAALYEHDLLAYATCRLREVPRLRIIGEARDKVAVVSFVMEDIHAHDLGTVLDSKGIAVRAGHHCAMPLMEFYGLAATARASLAFYNTPTEIDRLVDALGYARELLT